MNREKGTAGSYFPCRDLLIVNESAVIHIRGFFMICLNIHRADYITNLTKGQKVGLKTETVQLYFDKKRTDPQVGSKNG